MKYIDADKLIKAIEEKGLDCSFALKMERLDTLALIDELQQEQPDFPTTDEQMKEFLATHPKVEVPEKYKNPDWLFKKQEQTEVDLEKEVKKYWNAHALDYRVGRVADLDFIFLCARHFYELGLNAKKEK